MKKVVILNHPLIDHKMTIIRDKNTTTKSFRENVSEVSALITYEMTKDLETIDKEIETPIQKMVGKELKKPVIIVPILRAGLGMVEGIHDLIPSAKIGHIGMYRNEETLEPVPYYAKFPKELKEGVVLLLDPMLATGGSAAAAITELKRYGATDIRYVGLVGVQKGIDRLHSEHPEVPIYLASLDEKLNDDSYIVPGLGDCGDRLFGTK